MFLSSRTVEVADWIKPLALLDEEKPCGDPVLDSEQQSLLPAPDKRGLGKRKARAGSAALVLKETSNWGVALFERLHIGYFLTSTSGSALMARFTLLWIV